MIEIGSFELSLWALALFGLLASSCALAVHKTAAVYHDGLRTSVPELWKEQRPRLDLAKYSYAISFGFVLAYALPYSLATGIVVIHIILLTSDFLGLRFARRWSVALVSFAFGVAVTALIRAAGFGLQQIADYGPSLEQLFAPVAYTFPFLVAVTVAKQFGVRWGCAVAVATVALWRLVETISNGSDSALGTQAGAITLGIMTVFLASTIFMGARTESPGDALYADGIKRIRGHWPFLVLPPILIAVAASQEWLAGEPLQLVMLAVGSPEGAAAVAVFSALAFVPLIALSSSVSGVWNQDGYPDWYLGAGYLAKEPIPAAAAGLALVAIELTSLRKVVHVLMTRPRLHGIGSAGRDALDVVPGLSILAGAVLASAQLCGPVGAGVVVLMYVFNETKGRPVMPMAVPVFAFLAVAVSYQALGAWGVA